MTATVVKLVKTDTEEGQDGDAGLTGEKTGEGDVAATTANIKANTTTVTSVCFCFQFLCTLL